MNTEIVLEQLASMGNETDRAGMERFGIYAEKAFGIRIPKLRAYAKILGKDAELAQALWTTGYHEARLLASFIMPQKALSHELIEAWLQDLNSWDVCDQACVLFCKHPDAFAYALEWTERKETFQKRAGFALMACLAVHRKEARNEKFLPYFDAIEQHATDERNFVRKAVNWALRQMGKRNLYLHQIAVETASRLRQSENKTARWIGTDALRELSDAKHLEAIRKKEEKQTMVAFKKAKLKF